jgi:hypothetical protein
MSQELTIAARTMMKAQAKVSEAEAAQLRASQSMKVALDELWTAIDDLNFAAERLASVDTHPKDGDASSAAPLVSGAAPRSGETPK